MPEPAYTNMRARRSTVERLNQLKAACGHENSDETLRLLLDDHGQPETMAGGGNWTGDGMSTARERLEEYQAADRGLEETLAEVESVDRQLQGSANNRTGLARVTRRGRRTLMRAQAYNQGADRGSDYGAVCGAG
jgi:hypothetical protein